MSESKRLFHGLPVRDATRPRIVKVTKKDVTGGYTMLPNYCVVAHALGRNENGAKVSEAHPTKVFIREGDYWVRYQTSYSLRTEIVVHDRGGEFREGEYKLLPVPMSNRFGAPHAPRKKTAKKREHQWVTGVRERALYGGEKE